MSSINSMESLWEMQCPNSLRLTALRTTMAWAWHRLWPRLSGETEGAETRTGMSRWVDESETSKRVPVDTYETCLWPCICAICLVPSPYNCPARLPKDTNGISRESVVSSRFSWKEFGNDGSPPQNFLHKSISNGGVSTLQKSILLGGAWLYLSLSWRTCDGGVGRPKISRSQKCTLW